MESYTTSGLHAVTPEADRWLNSSNRMVNGTIFMEEKLEKLMWTYVPPIVVTVGTIGNVLSFVVLLRSRMRSTSVYFYLMVLACADTMVLYVSAFKTWIRVITGFELLLASNALCKITFFLVLASFHLAAWIVVLITLDRFIVVWFPLKATTMCLLSRARLATVILIVVIVLYNGHVFWTFGLYQVQGGAWRCYPLKEYSSSWILPFNILRLITYSLLPFLAILVLNVAIIIRLHRTPLGLRGQNRTQRSLIQNHTQAKGSYTQTKGSYNQTKGSYTQTKGSYTQTKGSCIRARTSSDQQDRLSLGRRTTNTTTQLHNRLTYMLLSISIAWLLLTTPWTVETLINHTVSEDRLTKARQNLAKTICFMLYYINHSINFFLYCVTGNKFRRQLVELFVHLSTSFRRPAHSPSVKTLRSNFLELDVGPETYVRGVQSKTSRSDSKS